MKRLILHETRAARSQAAQTPPKRQATAKSTEIAEPLTAATRRLVDGIRDEFDGFVDGYIALEADRDKIATHFMRAFNAWQKETDGTFVGFVRLLVPKVPEDRDGYKAHPAYQAADHLRRKVADAQRERETPEVAEEDRPASTLTALERLIATVMPIIDPTGSIWSAFVKELNWSEEQAQRIRDRASKLGSIKLPPRVKHALETRAIQRAA